jgi:hypothetical protein
MPAKEYAFFSTVNNTYVKLTKLSSKVHEYFNKETLPVGPIIITAG